jgi:hypothetical protein
MRVGLCQIKSPMTQNCNCEKPASARMAGCMDIVPPITCRGSNHVTTSDQVNLVSGRSQPSSVHISAQNLD